jgi:hypothetical protein
MPDPESQRPSGAISKLLTRTRPVINRCRSVTLPSAAITVGRPVTRPPPVSKTPDASNAFSPPGFTLHLWPTEFDRHQPNRPLHPLVGRSPTTQRQLPRLIPRRLNAHLRQAVNAKPPFNSAMLCSKCVARDSLSPTCSQHYRGSLTDTKWDKHPIPTPSQYRPVLCLCI